MIIVVTSMMVVVLMMMMMVMIQSETITSYSCGSLSTCIACCSHSQIMSQF